MGQVNQPSNLLDQIKAIKGELNRLWKAVGLSSATISRGGLTLLQDAFIRMVDDNDHLILYVGPDPDGRQVFQLRRETGALVMETYFSAGGNQFWALYDGAQNIVASDDAEAGVGLARPWLPVPMYPLFHPEGVNNTTFPYSRIAVASLAGETLLWEGRATISHPWIQIDGLWGEAPGANSCTYRLYINSNLVGTWTTGPLEVSRKGPFDVSSYIHQDWAAVRLTAAASGANFIACQVLGCYLRQT